MHRDEASLTTTKGRHRQQLELSSILTADQHVDCRQCMFEGCVKIWHLAQYNFAFTSIAMLAITFSTDRRVPMRSGRNLLMLAAAARYMVSCTVTAQQRVFLDTCSCISSSDRQAERSPVVTSSQLVSLQLALFGPVQWFLTSWLDAIHG